MELISHHQPEYFWKGKKETPHVCLPTRIPLTSTHLGWAMHAPPGRTLSQKDWSKTTWKLIPSPKSPKLQAMCQSSSPGFPYPTALHPVSFPDKISCFVSTCVSSDNSFLSVRKEPSLVQALEGVPLPATKSIPNIHWKDFCWSWSSNTLAT